MPLSSRVRVMLSSQMLWPASCSAWVRFMAFCLPSGALRITSGRGSFPAPAGQLVLGRLDHMAGLEAEFGLDLLDGRSARSRRGPGLRPGRNGRGPAWAAAGGTAPARSAHAVAAG